MLLSLTLLLSAPVLAEPERIQLHQRQDVQTDHQRMVGNVRAQAQREGVVVQVPQLFAYLSDYAAAFHMSGHRSGFERELNLVVQRSRKARSTVRLDRLLERVITPEGAEFGLEDLPSADVYLVLYRRAACETCDQVDEIVGEWLDDHPDIKAVRLDVSLDLPS